jgi:hypothetical protein
MGQRLTKSRRGPNKKRGTEARALRRLAAETRPGVILFSQAPLTADQTPAVDIGQERPQHKPTISLEL